MPTESIIDEVLSASSVRQHSYTGEDLVGDFMPRFALHTQQTMQTPHKLQDATSRTVPRSGIPQSGKMDCRRQRYPHSISISAASHRMAMNRMRGSFSKELSALRDRLLHLTSLMELELDFSDHEELEFADRTELSAVASQIESVISRLTQSFSLWQCHQARSARGDNRRDQRRKINTAQPACRRRTRHCQRHSWHHTRCDRRWNIGGIDFRFIDTAGIRDTTDTIEGIGIQRTMEKVGQAEVVLLMIDATHAAQQYSELAAKVLPLCQGKQVVTIINKADLAHPTLNATEPSSTVIYLSAKTGDGMAQLRSRLLMGAKRHQRCHRQQRTPLQRPHHRPPRHIRRVQQSLTDATPTDLISGTSTTASTISRNHRRLHQHR